MRWRVMLILVACSLVGCGADERTASTTDRTAVATASPAVDQEDAVELHLPLAGSGLGSKSDVQDIFELEDRLEPAVERVGGDYDGNEFGGGEAVLYAYGPRADTVFAAMRRAFGTFGIRSGAYAILTHAGKDRRVTLKPTARTE